MGNDSQEHIVRYDEEVKHLARAWGLGLEDTDARRHMEWYLAWLMRRDLWLWPNPDLKRLPRVLDDDDLTAEGSAFTYEYYRDYTRELAELGLPLYQNHEPEGATERVWAMLDARRQAWRERVGWSRETTCPAARLEALLASALEVGQEAVVDMLRRLKLHLEDELGRGITSGVPGVITLKPLQRAGVTNPRSGGGLSFVVDRPEFTAKWLRVSANGRPYDGAVVAPLSLRDSLAVHDQAGQRFPKRLAATLHQALLQHDRVELTGVGLFIRKRRTVEHRYDYMTGEQTRVRHRYIDAVLFEPWLEERLGTAGTVEERYHKRTGR